MSRVRDGLRPRVAVLTAIVVAVGGGLTAVALPDKADAKPARNERTGDQLYAINCARCHTERYATERTDAQWQTIMLHMRTRAQIPAKDAEKILDYLKETN